MTIGNVPGDAFASAVVDTLTDSVSAGSFGVVSVARTGPTSYRVTLSSPTNADACMCVVEIDGGTPTVINATPVSPTVWDVDWAPVVAGLSSVTGLAPVVATTAGTAVVVSFIAGTAPGQVLEWNGTKWLPATPAGGAWTLYSSLGRQHNDPTPTDIGGAYIDGPKTLAATCTVLFRSNAANWRGIVRFVNSGGGVVCVFDTGNQVGPSYAVASINAATTLPTGWYSIELSSILLGPVEALGFWLTE